MRYPASEKLEIIHLVERSHLPVRRTLAKLGIPTTTFYRWYDRYRAFDEAGLEDRNCGPGRVWNRIPDDIRGQIVELALDEPELSPRELAVTFTDRKGYFVSEASVYRLLKAHDLITSPAFVVIKAADEFHDKTTAPNQLWQTDFTYLKVIGWGWFYLSTILDDFSRYIIAWKLCTTMRAEDVTDTLMLALQASGQRLVLHRRRSCRLAQASGHGSRPRCTKPSSDPGQNRALASNPEELRSAGELLSAGRPRGHRRRVRRALQLPPLPRKHRQPHPRRRLLRPGSNHYREKEKNQRTDHPKTPPGSPAASRLTSITMSQGLR